MIINAKIAVFFNCALTFQLNMSVHSNLKIVLNSHILTFIDVMVEFSLYTAYRFHIKFGITIL